MTSTRISRISSVAIAEAGLPVLVAAGFVVGSALLASAATLGPLGYGLLIAGAVSLLVRRRHPVVALAGTLVPAFAYDLLNFPGGLCTIAVGVALFSVRMPGTRERGSARSSRSSAVSSGSESCSDEGTSLISSPPCGSRAGSSPASSSARRRGADGHTSKRSSSERSRPSGAARTRRAGEPVRSAFASRARFTMSWPTGSR
jgi:hypothetical protein